VNDTNKEEKNPYAPPVVPEGATPSGASPSEASTADDADRPVPMTAFERRFKHPPGLVILFFAEMWERFSYYGMRGLLKLYMANFLFVTVRQRLQGGAYDGTGDPSTTYGWTFIEKHLLSAPNPSELTECIGPKVEALMKGDAAHNIAPLASDVAHKIAEQTCVANTHGSVLYGWYTGLVYLTPFFGGILADRWLGQRKTVLVGGALMALGHFVMAIESSFFLALFLLIIGNGAFKPNISTQVGNLYPAGDPRRDGAFTIFYMGINLGAFICNFVCGTLAAVYGWHYGFGAAGVGMVIGLITYMAKQNLLAPDNLAKKKAAAASSPTPSAPEDKRPLDKGEWTRVWALVALCALNVVFWAVYEQQGNTMQTWADEQTVWPTVFGWQIPSTWFQSFNPAFIFLLAIPLDMFWAWQAKKGTEPSSVSKMAIGCFILGGSFIVMIVGAQMVGSGKGSLFWPVFCTLLLTIGELYLSPIGLSLVTKVSPVRIVSMMMGMWFLSSFLGNTLSGYIGVLYTKWSKEMFFGLLTVLGVGAGLAMWAFNRPLKKAIGDH
jgi:POT family proton-dependent oligopeptide transporter